MRKKKSFGYIKTNLSLFFSRKKKKKETSEGLLHKCFREIEANKEKKEQIGFWYLKIHKNEVEYQLLFYFHTKHC